MKEWTDQEIVAEFMKEGLTSELNGDIAPSMTIENLQRVIFDPRFPESKKELGLQLMNAFKENGVLNLNKKTDDRNQKI
ncbi:MAG TPA: hypothetical protein DCL77_14580 [Prolixibacteraceae bacterium]|jgi:hypothetical protein|nr:hypothetical protein [Prolixibacteraceae bacterium]